jgi:sulfate transport system ATP-binding protein
MQVEIRSLAKSFGATRVLGAINLDVREGELCALLGPSGSGKTTLLRIIAGLDFPDSGQLQFDGVDVLTRNARDRQVGFVFQHYALFRHMTISENVAFGLKVRPRATRPGAAQIARKVGELLELVQLSGFGERFPDQLSGGQRQRVALARALAIEPQILLLDEPFGALDARVRKEMRRWLRELQQRIGLTSIFVTHDQDEALELADRVAVMEHGEILQVGPPREVYDQPAAPSVYDFLGGANRLPCRVLNGQVLIGEQWLGRVEGPDDEAAALLVRAHDLEVLPLSASSGVPAVIVHIGLTGGTATLISRLDSGQEVESELPRWALDALDAKPGQTVRLRPRRYGLFGPKTGAHPAAGATYR